MLDILGIQVQNLARLDYIANAFKEHAWVSGILDEASAVLFNRQRTRFLQQVDPDSLPWKESYAAQIRASTGRGGGTLYDTGRLFHSLQLFKDSPMSRVIGTDVPYAPLHQYGTIKLVKRQFLGFGVNDQAYAQDLGLKRFQEILGG
jgi:phage gpG-like protein